MITEDLIVPAVLALVALLVAGLLVVTLILLRREKARGREQRATSLGENAVLRARVDELARRFESRAMASGEQEYLITGMGQVAEGSGHRDGHRDERDGAGFPERHIDGRLFADIMLRESVVKAAAFTHGVRRALAPQTRNRIRFEMRREVKRSRKERKVELRDVRRELAQRQRAAREQDRQEQDRPDQAAGRSEEVA